MDGAVSVPLYFSRYFTANQVCSPLKQNLFLISCMKKAFDILYWEERIEADFHFRYCSSTSETNCSTPIDL